ncbi:MAG: hypothetical protein JJT94_14340 [Bernardetiaceae bacterium]|nr:hypothetical protein [Bernardetiaceae bacterium]
MKNIVILFLVFLANIKVYANDIDSFLSQYGINTDETQYFVLLTANDCSRCVGISKFITKELNRLNKPIIFVLNTENRDERDLLLYRLIGFANTDLTKVRVIENADFFKALAVNERTSIALVRSSQILYQNLLTETDFDKLLSVDKEKEEKDYDVHKIQTYTQIEADRFYDVPYQMFNFDTNNFVFFLDSYDLLQWIEIDNTEKSFYIKKDISLHDSIYYQLIEDYAADEANETAFILSQESILEDLGLKKMQMLQYGYAQGKHYLFINAHYPHRSSQDPDKITVRSLLCFLVFDKKFSHLLETYQVAQHRTEKAVFTPKSHAPLAITDNFIAFQIGSVHAAEQSFFQDYDYPALIFYRKEGNQLVFDSFSSFSIPAYQVSQELFYEKYAQGYFFADTSGTLHIGYHFYPQIAMLTDTKLKALEGFEQVSYDAQNDKLTTSLYSFQMVFDVQNNLVILGRKRNTAENTSNLVLLVLDGNSKSILYEKDVNDWLEGYSPKNILLTAENIYVLAVDEQSQATWLEFAYR